LGLDLFIRGSPELWQVFSMGTMLTMVAMTATLATPAAAQAERVRACLSPQETRESVTAHQLREPLTLLRDAARETRAEPLNSRLCRWNEQFVYEMSLLRRDGRVLRVFVDAASGNKIPARETSGQGR
jgi:hypothetical protein